MGLYIIVTVLILLIAVLLMLVVLIQNPKGGGLGSTFGGSNQNSMGFQRTTDFLEKATWGLLIILISLTLLSNILLPERQIEGVQETELEGEVSAPTYDNMPVPLDNEAFEEEDGAEGLGTE